MKQIFFVIALLAACFLHPAHATAADAPPDTVRCGIYITSIHDIDFKDKEFTINFWLWLKYKNKDFDFVQNLEVPGAKTVSKSFSTVDTSDGETYLLLKMQCVMKDSWKIDNFPFDHQKLRLSIENSQFDSKALVFLADTAGAHFDKKFTLRGWSIDSIDITTGIKRYETTFGDASVQTPYTEYSNFKVRLTIDRDAMGLFWKMFLGMYVAFLIAYMCFYIHSDSIDSRFGLSVGALFAVIGNKYIIDSALPESSSFTLVDMLHGVTLFFILVIIVCSAISLIFVKQFKGEKANKFDKMASLVTIALYIGFNIYFIANAVK